MPLRRGSLPDIDKQQTGFMNIVAENLLRLPWFVTHIVSGRGGPWNLLSCRLTTQCSFKSITEEIEFRDDAVMYQSIYRCRRGDLIVKIFSHWENSK